MNAQINRDDFSSASIRMGRQSHRNDRRWYAFHAIEHNWSRNILGDLR